MTTVKQGVDARTGRIIPIKEAERRKATAYVRVVKIPTPRKRK